MLLTISTLLITSKTITIIQCEYNPYVILRSQTLSK